MNVEHYLGIPFVKGGRDCARGLDCWGLVKLFYDLQFGIQLSTHAAPLGQLTRREDARTEIESGVWTEVTEPQDGDGVGLGTVHGLNHVGIYIEANGEPSLLHSQSNCSTIQTLRYLREHGFHVIRFFRHADRS